MLLVNAVKTVCDFLLYFSFASLIAAYSGAWPLMGLILLLAFLSSLILQKTRGTLPARILCGLLPALGLFAARSLAEAVITAIILAFYFVLTLAGKNEIHYEDYKYWYGFPAVPVIVLFVICIGKWPVRPAAVVCAALYLFLGVLVLRRKRMGAGAGLKLRLLNLAELAGLAVFAVLASVLIYTGMRYSGRIVETVLLPFGLLLNALVYLLDRFIGLFKNSLPEEPLTPEETDIPVQENVIYDEPIPSDPRDETVFPQVEMMLRILLILLALAFLAYLLYRFCRMIRNTRTAGSGGAEAIEEGAEESLGPRRLRWKRKKLSGPSNNEKVRMIYKEYLFHVKYSGVEIARHTTSEDVLAASGSLTAPGEAQRMRELYIRARYHNSEEMSDAEVEEAKTLLAHIREELEARKVARTI